MNKMEAGQVEMVDVVDENNRVIGETPRKGVHKTDKLHRAVHIFMLDSDGRLWIERRGQSVDTHPGFYDSSAADHVSKGESYDEAARREALEELGIEDLELKPCYDLPLGPDTKNEFVRLYITKSDRKPRLHEGISRFICNHRTFQEQQESVRCNKCCRRGIYKFYMRL